MEICYIIVQHCTYHTIHEKLMVGPHVHVYTISWPVAVHWLGIITVISIATVLVLYRVFVMSVEVHTIL